MEDDTSSGRIMRNEWVYDPWTERRVPKQDYVNGLEDRLEKARYDWEMVPIARSYLGFASRDGSCDYTLLEKAINIVSDSDEFSLSEQREIKGSGKGKK